MSIEDYANAAINTVEESLKKNTIRKLKKIDTLMIRTYSTELDGTSELNTNVITFFQELIGMLLWAIELGRVNLLHEVALLS